MQANTSRTYIQLTQIHIEALRNHFSFQEEAGNKMNELLSEWAKMEEAYSKQLNNLAGRLAKYLEASTQPYQYDCTLTSKGRTSLRVDC